MKTWEAMYGLIWLSFAQMILILYLPFGISALTLAVHAPLGVIIFALAFYISRKVQASGCPDRVKRITRATRNFALAEGGAGLVYAAAILYGLPNLLLLALKFFHVAIALAIITQASSSATSYDMWEEKEFNEGPAPSAVRA